MRTFEGHKGSISSLHLGMDSRFALSGSWDKTLKFWDVATGLCLRTFEGHADGVNSITLNADNCFALSGSADSTMKLWNVQTGYCLRTFEGHTDGVTSVCLSADSRFALSGSADGTMKLWKVDTGSCLHSFLRGSEKLLCLSPDWRFALSSKWIYGQKLDNYVARLLVLDWELENQPVVNWDEGARPYLENFLTLHTPYITTLPEDRDPSDKEITLALTRRGIPTWTEEDFQNLLYTLGSAGYGWLRPEGVRQQLQKELAQDKLLDEQVVKYYTKFIEANPNSASAFQYRALYYYYLGEYEQALNDCNCSIELEPSFIDAYETIYLVHTELKNHLQAFEINSHIVKMKLNQAYSYAEEGSAYILLGESQQAFEYFRKACELYQVCGDIENYQTVMDILRTFQPKQ
ncbi:hypothetical protein OGM63_16755 [Plectonema radiosum NIES-515]|uniref:WD-40 repeat-containing protein n=1 Tax=Plectonema radiosum NIES-515 TaxID=2986073 RepID=A0ABT3B1A3_9CYAN|nr:hypothetical protein [Plectonema radiosum]MCV3215142.1 hypothetical protein [Plectonema radiosum NIES-515]